MSALRKRFEDWLCQSQTGRVPVEIGWRVGLVAFFTWTSGFEVHTANLTYSFDTAPYWYRLCVYCAIWGAVEGTVRLHRMLWRRRS